MSALPSTADMACALRMLWNDGVCTAPKSRHLMRWRRCPLSARGGPSARRRTEEPSGSSCPSHSSRLCRAAALPLSRLRDRKYLAHVRSGGRTKTRGVGRKRAAFVPERGHGSRNGLRRCMMRATRRRQRCVGSTEGAIATPCPASASANNACGDLLSTKILGFSPASGARGDGIAPRL
jgi:hypothetical protein